MLPLNLGIGTRRHTRAYDVMGRPLSVSVESNEAGGAQVTRTFTHSYDVPNGTYTRTGPDNVQTFVQLDAANRVQYVERRTAGNPPTVLMSATYAYQPNGYVSTVTYGNGTRVAYVYEGHRLAAIEHQEGIDFSQRLLRLDYEYSDNDLPWRITEYGAGPVSTPTVQAVTTFAYDRRGRVTGEARMYFLDPSDATQNYYLEYGYDAGGNRTVKIDDYNLRRVEYHYDVDADADPAVYASRNNRLMWYETWDTTDPAAPRSLSRTYYVYTYDSTDERRAGKSDGNVTRIITEHVAEAGSANSVVERGLRGGHRPTFKSRNERGTAVSAAGGGTCGVGETLYTAIRLGYAANGQGVTFVHDESWCAVAGQTTCAPSPGNKYAITWAREFRYDGARARYLDRKLDPVLFKNGSQVELDATWSDYDGEEGYGDYHVTAGYPPVVSNTDAYEPGLWRKVGTASEYLHSDMLGTLRLTTGTSGSAGASRVFTAFGERQVGSSDRFGYVGAWGYQQHEDFPFLHVGARYYDPSSGRFLQRDPIGILGGRNVYVYVGSSPASRIDPKGLTSNTEPVYRPVKPPRPPEPPSPQQELQDIKKGWWVTCAIGGLLAKVSGGLTAIPFLITGLIDQAMHPDEPLNPVFGGSYEDYSPPPPSGSGGAG